MVTPRYLPDMGGIETHVDEVARRLAKGDNFDVTIVTTDRSRKHAHYEVINNVTVLRVSAWPRNRDYYFAPGIAKIVMRKEKWDVIHCQGAHTLVPLIAMLAAELRKIPYIVTFHTGGHSLRHRNVMRAIQWRVLGPMLRKASSLVAVSQFEADTLSAQARLSQEHIAVIRNGGTLPPPKFGTRAVPGRIVSCGRLERYKGHHRVIEALPEVTKDVPDAHLVIIGRGPYETELRNCAQRHGVSDRVTIIELPPSDREGMATALAKACVVAALSDYEAHPVAVMEALSVGRTVVGYDVAGVGELVAQKLVRGVSPGAPTSTVAKELRDAMQASLPSVIPNLPTWDTTAQELEQLYLSVTPKNRQRIFETYRLPN